MIIQVNTPKFNNSHLEFLNLMYIKTKMNLTNSKQVKIKCNKISNIINFKANKEYSFQILIINNNNLNNNQDINLMLINRT